MTSSGRRKFFLVIDLTSQVTGWPRTLNSGVNGFLSWQATRWFFNRSSNSHRSQTRGMSYRPPPPPLCREGWRNGECRRGLSPNQTCAWFHGNRFRSGRNQSRNQSLFKKSPRNQNRNQFLRTRVGIGIDSTNEWPIPAPNDPKWPVRPQYARPVWFFLTATGYFAAMLHARSHIYLGWGLDFWPFLFEGGSCHGPPPPYGIKTESIPEPKVRSQNQSFLVNWNRNQFHMAMLCWNRNRNQLQFFRGESESIPVSWNQAQVWS